MSIETRDLDTDLADLESAEDFLTYFEIDYDRAVVQVNRLHILQRFHDYLAVRKPGAAPEFEDYRGALAMAYNDFVKSDALTEKVFSVLKRASGIATVPLSAISRAKH
ncbi:MAG: nitrogenase-stabilizing/protective protein NifW [Rhodopseudomonas sp.]|uniref:nitrogenase-stabilizing/protective protein NifW n=1 Tax=Rhodopseudomonas sp. TaxID=1078 RepID=UPI00178FFEFE|nr:nitrogenase-stabilizing/protective protein NifW [Rhodopseudomonas sp.]NVN88928.1 nitrogenase-stabilizing/protective protein NifW [Rhodopseudomonas sp.]